MTVKDTFIPIMIKMKSTKIMITCSGLISFHKSKRRWSKINPEITSYDHLKIKIITWTFKIIESIRLSVWEHCQLLMVVEINMKTKRVIALDILILDRTKFN